ncbi:MAG: M23 family metallopeptidase [Acidobacteriota bacterium]
MIAGLAAAALTAAAVAGVRLIDAHPEEAAVVTRVAADIVLPRDAEIVSVSVPPGTTLAALLASLSVTPADVAALVSAAGGQFDLRRFRAGQTLVLDRLLDGHVRAFAYEIDADRVLRMERGADGFDAEIAAIPKQYEQIVVQGAITRQTPSLVQAFDAAGERIDLALALADVFSGDIDFNSDVQPDDSFRLVVERATREDGRFAGYGPVLAAEFVNAGRTLRAIRFTPPGGRPGYYDEQGRSIRRFFLKSPLKFEPRITSRYSRARRHPVLNITRAHNGVDYSAPHGAPVVAVSAGVVTQAGWTAGGGNTVRVRHASGYESEYLHLSSIAVRRGARVGQGDLVGRVGATGLVTGTHLHYGLRRNGRYVNPVTEHRNMPPGEPIAAVHLAAFQAERDRLFSAAASPLRATN